MKDSKILTDSEIDYLSAVIKPYKSLFKSLYKTILTSKEYIVINLKNKEFILLPGEEINTTYKGLKLNFIYMSNELELRL